MRIAYLILCHKNSLQVESLIDQLDSDDVDFYVHIDNKNDNFKLRDRTNLHVLPSEFRVDVQWATFSMIEAELNLIYSMISTNIKYDYAVLLSGQDFPIKSNAYINKYLENHVGDNFIDVISHDNSLFEGYMKRTEMYYFSFMQRRTFISKSIRKMYMVLLGNIKSLKRKHPANLNFEFGSQWWVLSLDFLNWVIMFLDQNPFYSEFYKHSMAPDESFFQTLIVSSPFCETIRPSLTFLTWNSSDNHPDALAVKDVAKVIDSDNYLFCRKIEDTKVISFIREHICNK